ncbi:hypothetical protein BDW69DRAFT_126714 [Aspergillus filifer]
MVRSRLNRATMGPLASGYQYAKTYPIMTTKVRLVILDFQLPTLPDSCTLSRKRRLRRALIPKYNPPNARRGRVIKGCKVKRPPPTPPALPSRPTGSAGTKIRDIPMIGQVNRSEGFSKPSVTTGAHLSQRLSPGIVERGAVANFNYDSGAGVLNDRKSSLRVEKGEGRKSHLVHHNRTTRLFGTGITTGFIIVNFNDERRISRK